MAKNTKKIILIATAVLLCMVILVGCSYKFIPVTGGDPTADTISNNGIVARQGQYYYFINGLVAFDTLSDIKNNTYGTPLKGALCRTKLNAEGKFEDFQIVVPKVLVSKNKDQSFSIFGEFIYYASPSVTTDTDGVVQTGYTDFFRCKIDGTGVKKIATVEGDSLQYKFTDKGLVYLEGTTLKTVPYNSKSISGVKNIAEKVSSSVFSTTKSYKVGVETAQDYVFYSVAIEEEGVNASEVFATNGDGSNVVKMLDKTSYTEDVNDKKNQFTISLKMAEIESDGSVAIYYEKGGEYAEYVQGLYGIKLGKDPISKDYKFNIASEKRFSVKGGISAYPLGFENGVMLLDTTNTMVYIPKIVDGVDDINNRKEWKYKAGQSLSVADVVVTENGMYMLHVANNRVERINMKVQGRDRANIDDTGFSSNSYPIVESSMATDWLRYESLDGYLFYFNSSYNSYVFAIKESELVDIEKTGKGLKGMLVGKMTDADDKSYQKKLEDEKTAAEEDKD